MIVIPQFLSKEAKRKREKKTKKTRFYKSLCTNESKIQEFKIIPKRKRKDSLKI
jgi:predicted nucleic acid-binding protein